MTEQQLHEAADLISQARNVEMEDVESFLVALDRIDRWLSLPAQHDEDADAYDRARARAREDDDER